MSNLNISSASASDLTNRIDDVTVDVASMDSATDQEETTYMNDEWTQQWGYFNEIPELNSAILMKSIWNCGKGYISDFYTTAILNHVTGWGKDTFKDILFNMDVVRNIGGDSFAEIMRADDDAETLINLKPLNPEKMRIVVNPAGRLIRYEQISKFPAKGFINRIKNLVGKRAVETFKPEQIFHLSNNRLGDQIHGISRIKPMEKTILAMNEGFTDMKKIMHRQARPMVIFKLGTDDTTKIAAFIAKMDAALNKGENIYIPDDVNSVSYEVVQVNVSQMILEWQNSLNNKFYRAVGMPLVLFGQAGTTESGGKIEYLGHEQVFEHEQKYLEEQIWQQLGLRINLIPPTSLLENLQTDQAKDANQGMEIQPQDATAGAG